MPLDSELERMRALSTPPIKGSSVPGDADAAQRYARRCELRYYNDEDKMQQAATRLEVIAKGLSPADMALQLALREVAASLW